MIENNNLNLNNTPIDNGGSTKKKRTLFILIACLVILLVAAYFLNNYFKDYKSKTENKDLYSSLSEMMPDYFNSEEDKLDHEKGIGVFWGKCSTLGTDIPVDMTSLKSGNKIICTFNYEVGIDATKMTAKVRYGSGLKLDNIEVQNNFNYTKNESNINIDATNPNGISESGFVTISFTVTKEATLKNIFIKLYKINLTDEENNNYSYDNVLIPSENEVEYAYIWPKEKNSSNISTKLLIDTGENSYNRLDNLLMIEDDYLYLFKDKNLNKIQMLNKVELNENKNFSLNGMYINDKIYLRGIYSDGYLIDDFYYYYDTSDGIYLMHNGQNAKLISSKTKYAIYKDSKDSTYVLVGLDQYKSGTCSFKSDGSEICDKSELIEEYSYRNEKIDKNLAIFTTSNYNSDDEFNLTENTVIYDFTTGEIVSEFNGIWPRYFVLDDGTVIIYYINENDETQIVNLSNKKEYITDLDVNKFIYEENEDYRDIAYLINNNIAVFKSEKYALLDSNFNVVFDNKCDEIGSVNKDKFYCKEGTKTSIYDMKGNLVKQLQDKENIICESEDLYLSKYDSTVSVFNKNNKNIYSDKDEKYIESEERSYDCTVEDSFAIYTTYIDSEEVYDNTNYYSLYSLNGKNVKFQAGSTWTLKDYIIHSSVNKHNTKELTIDIYDKDLNATSIKYTTTKEIESTFTYELNDTVFVVDITFEDDSSYYIVANAKLNKILFNTSLLTKIVGIGNDYFYFTSYIGDTNGDKGFISSNDASKIKYLNIDNIYNVDFVNNKFLLSSGNNEYFFQAHEININ